MSPSEKVVWDVGLLVVLGKQYTEMWFHGLHPGHLSGRCGGETEGCGERRRASRKHKGLCRSASVPLSSNSPVAQPVEFGTQ